MQFPSQLKPYPLKKKETAPRDTDFFPRNQQWRRSESKQRRYGKVESLRVAAYREAIAIIDVPAHLRALARPTIPDKDRLPSESLRQSCPAPDIAENSAYDTP